MDIIQTEMYQQIPSQERKSRTPTRIPEESNLSQRRHRSRRRTRNSTAEIILNVILGILLVINLIVICMGQAIGHSAINKMPIAVIPVLSDSMNPMLKSGDAILTKQESFENIEVGDVVVYSKDGDLIVHQVIERDESKLITKGLANSVVDIPVTENEYRALMIGRIPLLGGIWRISSNPFKYAILTVLVVLLIFGRDIFESVYERFIDRNDEGEIS